MKTWQRNSLGCIEREEGGFTIVIPNDPANGDFVRLQAEIDAGEAEIADPPAPEPKEPALTREDRIDALFAAIDEGGGELKTALAAKLDERLAAKRG